MAVVTGGASGIGKAAAEIFLREGARVLVGDVKQADWVEDHDAAAFLQTDVRSPEQTRQLIDTASERWGRIDILFNNAGTAGRLPRPETKDLTVDEWEETIDINLKGVFLCSKAAIPHMIRQGEGVIVNNASILGVVGLPESTAYCASKGGVVLLTKETALELIPYGIRVNCVCASFIDTPMFEAWLDLQDDPEGAKRESVEKLPIKRLGSAEEVAKAVAFLASADASYVVGHALFVDGGYLAQ